MKNELLEIKNLAVQYTVDKEVAQAVNGISLTVKRGTRWGWLVKPEQERRLLL